MTAATIVAPVAALPLMPTPGRAVKHIWFLRANRAIDGLLRGKSSVTLKATLAANSTSSVISDARIGIYTYVGLMPQTASAATALASGELYITTGNGQATITHPDTADDDKTFTAVLIGA